MKLSIFIEQLQEIKQEHGDIDISMLDPNKHADSIITGTQLHALIDSNPKEVLLVDGETFESLYSYGEEED